MQCAGRGMRAPLDLGPTRLVRLEARCEDELHGSLDFAQSAAQSTR
jgi:hypothetical protein